MKIDFVKTVHSSTSRVSRVKTLGQRFGVTKNLFKVQRPSDTVVVRFGVVVGTKGVSHLHCVAHIVGFAVGETRGDGPGGEVVVFWYLVY